ncbi:MAG: hypothetical protein NTW86_12525 [Candidatus Sumerlaeota bacterium]|nr:hypothetical protein [Candidatus Sumerlaeota bacterium]
MNQDGMHRVRALSGKAVRLVFAAAFFALFAAVSCLTHTDKKDSSSSGKKESAASQPQSAEAMRVAVNAREFGREAECAVTGARFKVDAQSRAAIYRGRPFHFHDEEALQAFLKDPSQYQPDSLDTILRAGKP